VGKCSSCGTSELVAGVIGVCGQCLASGRAKGGVARDSLGQSYFRPGAQRLTGRVPPSDAPLAVSAVEGAEQ